MNRSISFDYVTKKVKICFTEILRFEGRKKYSQHFLRRLRNIATMSLLQTFVHRRRKAMAHKFLEDQLTLFKPAGGGQIMPT